MFHIIFCCQRIVQHTDGSTRTSLQTLMDARTLSAIVLAAPLAHQGCGSRYEEAPAEPREALQADEVAMTEDERRQHEENFVRLCSANDETCTSSHDRAMEVPSCILIIPFGLRCTLQCCYLRS